MSDPWESQEGEVITRDDEGNPESILVQSDSSSGPYLVKFSMLRIENQETDEESYVKAWTCTCKAYEYGKGKPCKHIRRVIPEPLIVDLSERTGHE